MYSMVLMAALTAGTATPDCHRCCGCCGCYGGCYGCWGGCYGGCMGCWGGCYGGCMGCYGGCMGCYGGCMGCYGGCMGGGYGGMGGGFGVGGAMTYPGTVYPGGGTIVPGGTTVPGGEPLQMPDDSSKSKKKQDTMLSTTKAKLVVELPSNAKLFIDDMPMKNVAGVRSFNTPELSPGQAYYYMVRVEGVRDGKPVSETRRVIVRAGQIARAGFKDMDTETQGVRTAQAK